MSDYKSSLPVRTEEAGDVSVKIVDGTITTQQLLVNPDGSINTNATVTATDLDIRDLVFATDKVDVSGSEVSLDSATLAALENITVSATDLDIRNLVFATDKVDVSGSEVSLDSATLAALENITVSATDLDIRDLAFATDKVDVSGSEVSLDSATLAALENITVSATDLDIRNLVFATDKVDVGGSVVALDSSTLAALENVTVSATDLDIRNLSAAQDNVQAWLRDEAGAAFSASNPLPVTVVDSEGSEVNDYNTVASVIKDATSNHDYTVTAAKTLKLTQVHASASGKMKVEVRIETGVASGVFNTRFVGFNSTANPNITFTLREAIAVAAGVRVRVIRTNLDNQPQDVYSTISGHEIP